MAVNTKVTGTKVNNTGLEFTSLIKITSLNLAFGKMVKELSGSIILSRPT